MGRLAIGVDFGGTKVLAGVVDVDTGKVKGVGKKKTDANDGPDELMQRVYDVARKAVDKSGAAIEEMAGICVGIAGQVDTDRGLRRLLDRHLGLARLERAAVPLHVVAYDVAAGEERLLSDFAIQLAQAFGNLRLESALATYRELGDAGGEGKAVSRIAMKGS